jgi:hypothetical protein
MNMDHNAIKSVFCLMTDRKNIIFSYRPAKNFGPFYIGLWLAFTAEFAECCDDWL